MYKAMGVTGQDGSWRDGVFSQADPFTPYQGSVNQAGDGSLGAIRLPQRRENKSLRPRAVKGYGALPPGSPRQRPFHMNRLRHPNTLLPAFGPAAMQGLGYTFRDGVLGDDATIPNISITAGQPAATPAKWSPDLASIGIGVVVGAALLYGMTRH